MSLPKSAAEVSQQFENAPLIEEAPLLLNEDDQLGVPIPTFISDDALLEQLHSDEASLKDSIEESKANMGLVLFAGAVLLPTAVVLTSDAFWHFTMDGTEVTRADMLRAWWATSAMGGLTVYAVQVWRNKVWPTKQKSEELEQVREELRKAS